MASEREIEDSASSEEQGISTAVWYHQLFCKQRMQMQRTRLKSLAYAIGQSMRIRHYGFANGYQSSKARSVGLQGNLDVGVMCHRSDG